MDIRYQETASAWAFIRPASLYFWKLCGREWLERLLLSGVTIRPCICGPCFGTVDVPANNTLGIRHASCNYYSREGS
ncbi:MAG: hypothetical protein ACLTBV_15240 [Enterocloster bolteae]